MKVLTLTIVLSLVLLELHTPQAQTTPPPKVQVSTSNSNAAPFIADEKSIRKLNELIENRAKALCSTIFLKYEMRFSDNSLYEMTSLEPIFLELNQGPRKIESISISFRSTYECNKQSAPVFHNDPHIEVVLSRTGYPEGLSYRISGDQRDWVYLVQSDITQQFSSMAMSYTLPEIVWLVGTTFYIFVLAFRILLIQARNSFNKRMLAKEPTKTPLTSSQFLLQVEYAFHAFAMISLIIALVWYNLTVQYFHRLWPSAVFLIGAEQNEYASIENIRMMVITTIISAIVMPLLWEMYRKFTKESLQ